MKEIFDFFKKLESKAQDAYVFIKKEICPYSNQSLIDTLFHETEAEIRKFSPEEFKSLCKKLGTNESLISLELSHSNDEEMQQLANSLILHPKLQTLMLYGKFSETGMQSITEILSNNPGIQKFKINAVITDPGFDIFVQYLATKTNIEILDLEGYQIDDARLEKLGLALEKNKSIKEINLSSNYQITNNGLKNLLSSLKDNTALKSIIFLGHEEITPDILPEIYKFSQLNHALTSFRLYSCEDNAHLHSKVQLAIDNFLSDKSHLLDNEAPTRPGEHSTSGCRR